MGGRGAILPAVALWIGLLCGVHHGEAGVAAGFAAAAFAWLAWRAPDRTGTAALVLALLFGGCARGSAHHAVLEHERDALCAPDGLHHVEAQITEPVLRASGEPVAVVRPLAATPALERGTRMRLRLPAGAPVEWGDRIVAYVRIEAPPGLRNPGGFDARAAAEASAIAATGRALWVIRTPHDGWDAWPRATFARWRRAIERRFDAGIEASARELVLPLLLGDRTALSSDSNAALRASGLIHLLALSGLHIVWMAAILRGVVASAGGGVRARACAGAFTALGYVGLAGPIPSLVRAAAVECLSSGARICGRALDPLQCLALTVLLLLAAAPGWCADLGFQLSCAATLGLVALGPALAGIAPHARPLAAAFAPTASAQITALPLLLARMHTFSWVGLVTNLAAVPISGLLLAAAWLAALTEIALPGAGRTLFRSTEALAAALRFVTEAGARSPGALLPAGHDPAIPALAALGALLLVFGAPAPGALAARGAERSPRRVAATGLGVVALALAIVCGLASPPLLPPAGRVWLVALDVGQGDALALGFEDGWWMVDTGPRTPSFDAGEAILLPFTRWAGLRRLAALVLTHDDGDHRGGARALLRSVHVDRVLVPPRFPGIPGPGARVRGRAVAREDTLRANPVVRVLWPPAPALASEPGAPAIDADNRACVVLEVTHGRQRIELLADVDSTVEAALAIEPRPELLKVAHHGSGSSSGAGFLDRVRPRTAILCCGRRNPFGHPHPGALERIAAAGARLRRTDHAGALWFELDGNGAREIEWRTRSPGSGRPPTVGSAPGTATAPRVR